ncbi:MAG: DUF4416 family protein [Candidatus Omnitrophota bacterium]
MNQNPVKLVASIIFKEDASLAGAEKKLIQKYGPLTSLERILPFDFTDYYEEEFGKPLKRKLLCFEKPVDMEKIADIKLTTNRIEDSFREDDKRTVNIDPGYITEAKLVLLTTKDYNHRVYLGRRIFAESTLYFQEGTFKPWPWTYPDYGSQPLISYFNEVRALYAEGLKKSK